MKKWYQPCGWMLLAALALELSGCAQGSAYLSKFSGHKKDDQKLVDVDGKAKKASPFGKKGDPAKAKSADSQLAKKDTKPKVQSSDDSSMELASAKDTTKPTKPTKPTKKSSEREALDPFQSDEFDALAARKSTSKKTDAPDEEATSTDVAKNDQQGALKRTAKAPADIDGSSPIQEVSHKVEDHPADADDIPDWATDKDGAAAGKATRKVAASTDANSASTDADQIDGAIGEKLKQPASARAAAKVEEDSAAIVLIELCPAATGEVGDLVRELNEKDIEGLKRGIHRIGRIGPEAQAAAPALVHLLKHKDGFVRTHAALALARMQASPPEAVQTVVDGLKSTDPGIRSFAAAVLAEMGPQASDALATLAESLKDRDGYVRLHAAEVLIRYDRWSYQALETLLGGLRDKDENIRWLATYSLAELAPESPETVEALIQATRDRVLKVQVGAVYALGEIGPFAKSSGAELRKLADSTPHPELQSAILYALQQIEQ